MSKMDYKEQNTNCSLSDDEVDVEFFLQKAEKRTKRIKRGEKIKSHRCSEIRLLK